MSTRLMRALARGLLAAMLLAVLAPAVSRSVASTRVAGDWMQLCTARGMAWVQLSANATGAVPVQPNDLLHALNDCGHCALTSERFAPLLPSWPQVQPDDGAWGAPPHQAQTLHHLDAPSPGARGPPLLG